MHGGAGGRQSLIGGHAAQDRVEVLIVLGEQQLDLVVDQPEYRAFLAAEGQPSMLGSVDKMAQPTSAYTGISRAPNKYHPAGYWAAKTVEFLKANRDKPFCAWLSFYGPHTPIIPSQRWAAMYNPEKITLAGNYPCKLTS